MASDREFDIVVHGPTGYTGRLCAEHIVKNLPTNLKWALAGRSISKIVNVAKDLKKLNPDRTDPGTVAVQLNVTELQALALRTKVLINCVGPYHLYSTPVVEACATTGTHYIDATGETPWVKRMVEKYHETAKSNGAIIIPCCGVESAPPDILTWALVRQVREQLSCHTREVTCAIDELKSSGLSGGTLSTILSSFEFFPYSELAASMKPFSLAASTPPNNFPRETLLEKIIGIRSIRDMGTLANSPMGMVDVNTVLRSSTLMPEFYGPRFYFRQFLRVRNAFIGVVFHVVMTIAMVLLVLPPVRWLLRKVVYAPGNGPRMEDSRDDRLVYRAIATPDQATPKRILGKLKADSTVYVLTGVVLAEAAMVILENEEKVKKVSRGGIVTPATLGQEYIDRLEKVGVVIETQLLEY